MSKRSLTRPPNICFVTGTRAEFGLMRRTLRAIQDKSELNLQLLVTGTHLDAACGSTIDEIRREKWKINSVVDWQDRAPHSGPAQAVGRAITTMADEFERLSTDVVLVVGDRVEAFAAASAAHLSGKVVVHIHGGERATGQLDDTMRHAISKLSHIHLCATRGANERLIRMGEDAWRIHTVGAPGLDGIRDDAISAKAMRELGIESAGDYILFLLHPCFAGDAANHAMAYELLGSLRGCQLPVIAMMPNGDAGSDGIRSALSSGLNERGMTVLTHVSRGAFLGLMRDARLMVGNSSSGIIEAASFGTPVLDVGPRQFGRETSGNVSHVEASPKELKEAIRRELARPIMTRVANVYGDGKSAGRIVRTLCELKPDRRLLIKTIAY